MRLFVLLSRVPYPLEKGDKLRAYHQIKELSQHNEIFLCCLSDSQIDPEAITHLSSFCKRVEVIRLSKIGILFNLIYALFSNKPFQVHYFRQAHAMRKVKRLVHEFNTEHIYCQLIRTTEYVKQLFEIPKTMDYQDALSKGMERRISNSPWWFKPIVRAEAKRLLAYENLVFEYFDNKTIISEQDRELIYHPNRKEIAVIPNGVDTEFFQPKNTEKEFDIVFTGNMNYPPNVTAADYLVNVILPVVQQTMPEVRVLISGANPANKVKALADKNVTVTGWVEDIRDSYAKSKVFVAPMQLGTGLQNKILEAMAMELPCITSELANNAIKAKTGETILLGANPQQYANHIVTLLKSEDQREKLGSSGRQFVLETYNWTSTTKALNNLFQTQ